MRFKDGGELKNLKSFEKKNKISICHGFSVPGVGRKEVIKNLKTNLNTMIEKNQLFHFLPTPHTHTKKTISNIIFLFMIVLLLLMPRMALFFH
jgi:hypothetical protein